MEILGHIQNCVIIPDDALSLPDGTAVTIVVRSAAPARKVTMSPCEQGSYRDALARIDAVPNENRGDAFSGADHDQALYGEQS